MTDRGPMNPMVDNPHDRGNAPSPLPVFIQRLGVAVVIIAIIIAGFFSLTEHWRRATVMLGGTLLWLSALRWACDSQVLGVLSVRSRKFDSLFTACCGGALIYLATSVDSLGS